MTRNPFEELEQMLERMSKQVEEGMIGPTVQPRSVSVDVRDEGEEYVVLADLPGYEAEEIDLTLSGRRLEVAAERDRDEESVEGDYVRRERTRESVSRTVHLPEEVDEGSVSASLDGGVLTVTLAKERSDDGHQIEIEED